jgi:lysyl-tRNA synthetase class 2
MPAPETPLRARLLQRAETYARIRGFFAERGVVEVQTPTLSAAGVTEPALASLTVDVRSLRGRRYLRTSPELAHKRLLAAGSGDIYELGRVYRDGELGRWHTPEFEMLEWYRVGFGEADLMDEVFALFQVVLDPAVPGLDPAVPELRRLDVRYADAFAQTFGIDAHRLDARDEDRVRGALLERHIDAPAAVSGQELLDLALATAIVPGWPRRTAIFLSDYPAAQAALARIRPGTPPVAARFEVFVNGIELGNGFHELRDPAEQRARFERDLARRRELGLPEPPIDEAFLQALDRGLPDCSGVAIGIDRLIAVQSGADTLADVMNFVPDTKS